MQLKAEEHKGQEDERVEGGRPMRTASCAHYFKRSQKIAGHGSGAPLQPPRARRARRGGCAAIDGGSSVREGTLGPLGCGTSGSGICFSDVDRRP